jgi:hypothetical protein
MFMGDLTRTLAAMPIIAVACVIDRPGYDYRYREQYGRRMWHLCQTAFSIVVERAAKHARRDTRKLRVLPERSNMKDEGHLQHYFDSMRVTGMPFDLTASSPYSPLTATELKETLRELRFKKKSSPMVQIADLILWPLAVNGYDADYRPYVALREAGRLIECHLDESDHSNCGTKYSCFDLVHQERRGR